MIEVISSGMHSTVQDAGRYGYRRFGVPLSGCMDQDSARLANALINNDQNAAVIEIMHHGPTLKFQSDVCIALAGAPFEVEVNNQSQWSNRRICLRAGDVLTIGRAQRGVFVYLALPGGVNIDPVLNSRSHFPHLGTKGALKSGEVLRYYGNLSNKASQNAHVAKFDYGRKLEVHPGPEWHTLNNDDRRTLINHHWKVDPQANRMSYPLGRCNITSAREIPTAAVQPGTIQLTPSGDLFALMRDAQTTGGYARVLQLSDESINSLAQTPHGTTVVFWLR